MAFTRELIAWDALNGIAQYHNYDVETGTSVFESVGDAGPALEQNKLIANDNSVWQKGVKNSFALYASIPTIFQLKLLMEKGIDVYKKEHGARLSRILEDPEYRHLKCTTKTHIIKSHD